MKILTLILLLAIASIGFAQSGGIIITSKASVFADSLQYEVSDTLNQKDSVYIINTNLKFEYARIIIKGSANSPVDSLGIQLGGIRYNNDGTAIDTLWGSFVSLKDSAWNTVQTIVNNTVGKDYSLYTMPVFQLMKVSILNHRATLVTRKLDILVELK